jgi:long-chain acyl-CoA synthetase
MATTVSSRPWLKHYSPEMATSLEYREAPLYTLLEDAARQYPDLPAVRFYGQQLTYAQVWAAAQRFAAGLAGLGVQKGDRVALMLPNCPQYVIAYFGTLLVGGTVAQVNPLYTPRELDYLLGDSGAQTIVVADVLTPVIQAASVKPRNVIVALLKGDIPLPDGAQWFERIVADSSGPAPRPEINPREDVAAFQYTGGTTGVSKAAMLTHFNLLANVQQLRAWNPVAGEAGSERILTIIPLFHSYGMTCCMNYGFASGYEIILLPRFDLPDVMQTIKATSSPIVSPSQGASLPSPSSTRSSTPGAAMPCLAR